MFDIGWTELALVALVALLVIGPKELPATMRMIAGWIGKIRSLAREFQGGLDDMMREAELDKLKEQAQGVMHGDLDTMVENTIDPDGKIRNELDYNAGYEPFGDFDVPETKPEKKPENKTEAKAADKPAAAAAETTPKKATAKSKAKSTSKTAGKASSKASANGDKAKAAKPRAQSAAKASAKTNSRPAAKSKSAATAKPSSSDTKQTDA